MENINPKWGAADGVPFVWGPGWRREWLRGELCGERELGENR